MPLENGKSKKVFSENVSTLMHEKYPQKQALAIAYSKMRKAGHKMAKGGMCPSCAGEVCKYADGTPPGGAQPAETYDEMQARKAKEQSDSSAGQGTVNSVHAMASGFAHGGEVRGVHQSSMEIDRPQDKKEKMWAGESMAGQDLRNSDINDSSKKHAYDAHHKVLGEMKAMPNPKLEGMAEGGEVDEDHELLDHCAGELIKAFETKNKKEILDSIKAIVLSLKG